MGRAALRRADSCLLKFRKLFATAHADCAFGSVGGVT